IPNPAVKTTCVLCGTVVREPTGSLASSEALALAPGIPAAFACFGRFARKYALRERCSLGSLSTTFFI
ncbi:MAG: hypothetical protein KAU14_07375, partial [Thermoplasmata archaeon]|nr:hypothetical protein [Thermoplasmata archaeon]